MQVTFTMLHGKTRKALDRFIAKNNLKQRQHLRGMMITGPNGDVEEFRR